MHCAGLTLTDRHSPMAKKKLNWRKENRTFAKLAKPEILHTTTMASGFDETKTRPSTSMTTIPKPIDPKALTIPIIFCNLVMESESF